MAVLRGSLQRGGLRRGVGRRLEAARTTGAIWGARELKSRKLGRAVGHTNQPQRPDFRAYSVRCTSLMIDSKT